MPNPKLNIATESSKKIPDYKNFGAIFDLKQTWRKLIDIVTEKTY